MIQPIPASMPFLNRDQLNFERGAKMELQIRCQASKANKLTIRGMTREGIFTFQHTTVNDSLPETENFRISDFPIWIMVDDTASVFSQGEVFVSLSVLVNGDKIFELCSGFVFTGKSISFPVGAGHDPMPGAGLITVMGGLNPAAGSDISDDVSTNQLWKIMSVAFSLVTDATVANRRVHFQVYGSGRVLIDAWSPVDQPASQTYKYVVAPYGFQPAAADNSYVLIPFPAGIVVPEFFTLRTETTLLKAGDDFGQPKYFIEQFFTPQ